MTDTLTQRFSLDAEQAVLGACFHGGMEEVKDLLAPGDFYSPERGAAFAAILGMYEQGIRPEVRAVAESMRRYGNAHDGTVIMLRDCELNPSSNGRALARYAHIVARDSLARQLTAVCSEGRTVLQDPATDPGEYLDSLKARLADVDSAIGVRGLGAVGIEDFLAKTPEMMAPWVIPGLLRSDWRVVTVADEGVGKSVLLTQLAVMASWGLHPFTPSDGPIPPMRVLIMDLENPEQEIHERMKRVSDSCRLLNPWRLEKQQCWLIRRPGGIDLRKRAHRLAFEADLRNYRPQMVALGPVYKCYSRTARENDEQVANEVQHVLDDLRTRYEFGLILEHHAPKAERGGKRDLVPFGSSLWLRWSELGLSLSRVDNKFPALVLKVGNYRGQRVANSWPDELRRGTNWPWEGKWDDGVPAESGESF